MNFNQINVALSTIPGYDIDDAYTEIEELFSDKKYEEADACINTLLAITVNNLGEHNDFVLDLLELRGDIYLETSRFDKAAQDYRKILEMPDIHSKIFPYQYADIHRKLGNVAYRRKDYKKALHLLNKAKALFESHEINRARPIAEINITRANVLVELGRIQEAWNTFLVNVYWKSLTLIEDVMTFITNHANFAEHLDNVGQTQKAEHFAICGITYALDYHKRISEFLVRAFRDLSAYYHSSDFEKSVDMMKKSGEIFKNMMIVQSYAPKGSEPA